MCAEDLQQISCKENLVLRGNNDDSLLVMIFTIADWDLINLNKFQQGVRNTLDRLIAHKTVVYCIYIGIYALLARNMITQTLTS